jgi:hypothetical protein
LSARIVQPGESLHPGRVYAANVYAPTSLASDRFAGALRLARPLTPPAQYLVQSGPGGRFTTILFDVGDSLPRDDVARDFLSAAQITDFVPLGITIVDVRSESIAERVVGTQHRAVAGAEQAASEAADAVRELPTRAGEVLQGVGETARSFASGFGFAWALLGIAGAYVLYRMVKGGALPITGGL